MTTSIYTHEFTAKKNQEQLHQMLSKLEQDQCQLFHMTLTYKSYQDRIYKQSDLDKFFTNFYLKTLLPDIFQSRTWTKTKKMNQPVALAFLDEHEQRPIANSHQIVISDSMLFRPNRLHHHVIIASRPYTTDFFSSLVGENTLLKYSSLFMTTDLRLCDTDRVFYASKMLWKYPNHQSFGYQ